MLRHQWVLKRLAVSVLAVTLVLLALYSSSSSSRPPPPVSDYSEYVSSSVEANNVTRPSTTTTTTTTTTTPSSVINQRRRRFAVFSCATPDEMKWNGSRSSNQQQQRQYDYAFYLPLTVLAWRRIGYESLVLIIGHRREWLYNPVLAHVLDTLETLKAATVLFLPAKVENRVMLSQTARIFTANLDGYPGGPSDFILTSDSDLWPLRKRYFYQQQPEGAEAERPLMLFHSDCCRPFVFKGHSYKMQPMSHVGASAATWQEMVNFQQQQPLQQQQSGGRTTNSSSSSSVEMPAKDSASIVDRLANIFGQQVRHRVQYASSDWFVDQKFISLSIHQWLNGRQRQTNSSAASMANNQMVYKVSDVGLRRLDRYNWNVNLKQLKASSSSLDMLDASYYDAHLPMGGFQPAKWNSIRPLLRLMYGGRGRGKAATSSSTYRFCDSYAITFRRLFMNSSTNRS